VRDGPVGGEAGQMAVGQRRCAIRLRLRRANAGSFAAQIQVGQSRGVDDKLDVANFKDMSCEGVGKVVASSPGWERNQRRQDG